MKQIKLKRDEVALKFEDSPRSVGPPRITRNWERNTSK